MSALMDITGLAERLNVPRNWVRDAVTARSIPITWVGRHARFTEADYEAILAAGHEEPIRAGIATPKPSRKPALRRVV